MKNNNKYVLILKRRKEKNTTHKSLEKEKIDIEVGRHNIDKPGIVSHARIIYTKMIKNMKPSIEKGTK